MKKMLLAIFSLILITSCARYKSQSPVQDPNILPTRYQNNTNENNPAYTRNSNFVLQKKPTAGVKISNDIAKTILRSYKSVESATVVVINKRAYVSISVNPKYRSTLGNLRYQIIALVKDMDPVVEKVTVSDHPNFYQMLKRYQR